MTTRVPEFELTEWDDSHFLIRWKNPPKFTDEELLEFIDLNNDSFEIEQDCDGSLLLESPVTFRTARGETRALDQLLRWAERDSTGEALGPTGRWYMRHGRYSHAPDAAWIRKDRVAMYSQEELSHVPQFRPDFVIEVRSKGQWLRRLQSKMEEWIANGVKLGWLIDEHTKTVYVYRPGQEVQVFDNATSLDASPELPGFVLDLRPIWE